jgi:hypothetical protein
MRRTTLGGFLFFSLLVLGSAHAQQLVVDCDAGGDLAQALEQAAASGLTWIAVEGRCVGDFEFESTVNIKIEGSNATLVSPGEGVVLRIGGRGFVTLVGFEIRSGAIGVQAVGADAWAIVNRCEVHDNGFGLATAKGARLSVTSSEIHHNDLGVFCSDDAGCLASDATIRDNRLGAWVGGQSDLQSFGTEISGNADGGVLFHERSTGSFDQSTLLENGSFHLALTDRSHVLLKNGTALGGPGDGTPLALVTGLLSSAETTRFGDAVEFFGDVLAADSSYLILDAVRVSGGVEVVDFAEVKLVRSEIAGSVVCRSGGDAICGEGSLARIDGCASARPRCSPHPWNQRRRHRAFFDWIERFTDNDNPR